MSQSKVSWPRAQHNLNTTLSEYNLLLKPRALDWVSSALPMPCLIANKSMCAGKKYFQQCQSDACKLHLKHSYKIRNMLLNRAEKKRWFVF